MSGSASSLEKPTTGLTGSPAVDQSIKRGDVVALEAHEYCQCFVVCTEIWNNKQYALVQVYSSDDPDKERLIGRRLWVYSSSLTPLLDYDDRALQYGECYKARLSRKYKVHIGDKVQVERDPKFGGTEIGVLEDLRCPHGHPIAYCKVTERKGNTSEHPLSVYTQFHLDGTSWKVLSRCQQDTALSPKTPEAEVLPEFKKPWDLLDPIVFNEDREFYKDSGFKKLSTYRQSLVKQVAKLCGTKALSFEANTHAYLCSIEATKILEHLNPEAGITDWSKHGGTSCGSLPFRDHFVGTGLKSFEWGRNDDDRAIVRVYVDTEVEASLKLRLNTKKRKTPPKRENPPRRWSAHKAARKTKSVRKCILSDDEEFCPSTKFFPSTKGVATAIVEEFCATLDMEDTNELEDFLEEDEKVLQACEDALTPLDTSSKDHNVIMNAIKTAYQRWKQDDEEDDDDWEEKVERTSLDCSIPSIQATQKAMKLVSPDTSLKALNDALALFICCERKGKNIRLPVSVNGAYVFNTRKGIEDMWAELHLTERRRISLRDSDQRTVVSVIADDENLSSLIAKISIAGEFKAYKDDPQMSGVFEKIATAQVYAMGDACTTEEICKAKKEAILMFECGVTDVVREKAYRQPKRFAVSFFMSYDLEDANDPKSDPTGCFHVNVNIIWDERMDKSWMRSMNNHLEKCLGHMDSSNQRKFVKELNFRNNNFESEVAYVAPPFNRTTDHQGFSIAVYYNKEEGAHVEKEEYRALDWDSERGKKIFKEALAYTSEAMAKVILEMFLTYEPRLGHGSESSVLRNPLRKYTHADNACVGPSFWLMKESFEERVIQFVQNF